MRLLLDTHVLIAVLRTRPPDGDGSIAYLLRDQPHPSFASVASLLEITIKTRLGKVDTGAALVDLPAILSRFDIQTLAIKVPHVLAELDPLPSTRDPFDRLLLAQCQVEGLRLVTGDRKLVEHPLAWRPS